MSCVSEFSRLFRQKGFRVTSQRMAILHVLRHAGGHLTPRQIHRLSRLEVPGLTEPTVYRTLDFLARNGFAAAARTSKGRLVYELAGHGHHHLTCRNCGRTLEIPAGSLRRMYRQIESDTGYRLDDNHLSLMGLCPQCRELQRS